MSPSLGEAPLMSSTKAYVFDAYGTLFDVHSILVRCEELFPGYGAQLTTLWRTKQLEYTWLRSLMGKYEDFWTITRDALMYSCHMLGVSGTAEKIDRLMQSYLALAPFPGTAEALDALALVPCAILSNGTPEMLRSLVRNAGWEGKFRHILSVDAVKVYKPHPSVYQLAVSALGVERHEIVFVSSNGWDVAGAKAFGCRVCWLNRSNAPVEALGVQPDWIVHKVEEIKGK
jgi:2-haloacid dehalogenase